jgi:hypothetical protein
LFFGNNKTKKLIENEIAERPLIYDNFAVTRKTQEKWLGDILSDGGLEKSAEATITNRYGRIIGAIFELKAAIEDLRMQMIGGIKCGLDIWEMALIPSLLNNASMWTNTDTARNRAGLSYACTVLGHSYSGYEYPDTEG